MQPMSASEKAAEKMRILREQEEADLALAMEAFGNISHLTDFIKNIHL